MAILDIDPNDINQEALNVFKEAMIVDFELSCSIQRWNSFYLCDCAERAYDSLGFDAIDHKAIAKQLIGLFDPGEEKRVGTCGLGFWPPARAGYSPARELALCFVLYWIESGEWKELLEFNKNYTE